MSTLYFNNGCIEAHKLEELMRKVSTKRLLKRLNWEELQKINIPAENEFSIPISIKRYPENLNHSISSIDTSDNSINLSGIWFNARKFNLTDIAIEHGTRYSRSAIVENEESAINILAKIKETSKDNVDIRTKSGAKTSSKKAKNSCYFIKRYSDGIAYCESGLGTYWIETHVDNLNIDLPDEKLQELGLLKKEQEQQKTKTKKENNMSKTSIKDAAAGTKVAVTDAALAGAKMRIGKKINQTAIKAVCGFVPDSIVKGIKDSDSATKVLPLVAFRPVFTEKVKTNGFAQLSTALVFKFLQEKFANDNTKLKVVADAMLASGSYESTEILEDLWDKIEDQIADAVGSTKELDMLIENETESDK